MNLKNPVAAKNVRTKKSLCKYLYKEEAELVCFFLCTVRITGTLTNNRQDKEEEFVNVMYNSILYHIDSKERCAMKLTERQDRLVSLLRNEGPLTAEAIAGRMDMKKTTLRPDLTFLVRSGILSAKPKVGYYFDGISNPSSQRNYTNLRVRDVLGPVQVVRENSSVYDAVVTLFLEDVETLFVVSDQDHLIGAISRKDLLKATIGGADLNKLPIGMVMTRLNHLVTVLEEDPLALAVNRLIEYEADAIPVVRPADKNVKRAFFVVGTISKTNITSLFYEQWLASDQKQDV
jgi:CBS domain-containing protein